MGSRQVAEALTGLDAISATYSVSNEFVVKGKSVASFAFNVTADDGAGSLTFLVEWSDDNTVWTQQQAGDAVEGVETLSDHTMIKTITGPRTIGFDMPVNAHLYCRISVKSDTGAPTLTGTVTLA